jgi:hypothetical protein
LSLIFKTGIGTRFFFEEIGLRIGTKIVYILILGELQVLRKSKDSPNTSLNLITGLGKVRHEDDVSIKIPLLSANHRKQLELKLMNYAKTFHKLNLS